MEEVGHGVDDPEGLGTGAAAPRASGPNLQESGVECLGSP